MRGVARRGGTGHGGRSVTHTECLIRLAGHDGARRWRHFDPARWSPRSEVPRVPCSSLPSQPHAVQGARAIRPLHLEAKQKITNLPMQCFIRLYGRLKDFGFGCLWIVILWSCSVVQMSDVQRSLPSAVACSWDRWPRVVCCRSLKQKKCERGMSSWSGLDETVCCN